MSAFFMFVIERRAELVAQNPDTPASAEAQQMGHEWQALPAEKKRVYEAKAAEDRARYEREVAEIAGAAAAASTSNTAVAVATTAEVE